LLFARTINLAQIATAFQSRCKEESPYRRIGGFLLTSPSTLDL
jgi:hypothetical protein